MSMSPKRKKLASSWKSVASIIVVDAVSVTGAGVALM